MTMKGSGSVRVAPSMETVSSMDSRSADWVWRIAGEVSRFKHRTLT